MQYSVYVVCMFFMCVCGCLSVHVCSCHIITYVFCVSVSNAMRIHCGYNDIHIQSVTHTVHITCNLDNELYINIWSPIFINGLEVNDAVVVVVVRVFVFLPTLYVHTFLLCIQNLFYMYK